MWNRQTTTEPQSQPSNSEVDNGRMTVPSALSSARIGTSLTIKGSVTGEEDLQIDGKVEGPVTIRGRLGFSHFLKTKASRPTSLPTPHGRERF
jgi:hypothetical protein